MPEDEFEPIEYYSQLCNDFYTIDDATLERWRADFQREIEKEEPFPDIFGMEEPKPIKKSAA